MRLDELRSTERGVSHLLTSRFSILWNKYDDGGILMDPNACWERFIQHVHDGEMSEALHAICDLEEWIDRGGFLPNGVAVETIRKIRAYFADLDPCEIGDCRTEFSDWADVNLEIEWDEL